MYLVPIACERPEQLGRSLAPRDGPELARPVIAQGIVIALSSATVRRLLASAQTLAAPDVAQPQTPRDKAF
jgi:hypothetical protein